MALVFRVLRMPLPRAIAAKIMTGAAVQNLRNRNRLGLSPDLIP